MWVGNVMWVGRVGCVSLIVKVGWVIVKVGCVSVIVKVGWVIVKVGCVSVIVKVGWVIVKVVWVGRVKVVGRVTVGISTTAGMAHHRMFTAPGASVTPLITIWKLPGGVALAGT
jgi:hypothetical protein